MNSIERRYPDLLGQRPDVETAMVVEVLDKAYAITMPASVDTLVAGALQRATIERRRGRRFSRWGRRALFLAAFALVISSAAVAATNITNLGRPTSDQPVVGALSSFRHTNVILRQHGKAELLFIGTQIDSSSAAVRWPVVKALQQFGTLSNVQAALSPDCFKDANGAVHCVPFYDAYPGVFTFDWSHARYRSHYLVFVHKDLIDRRLQERQTLSPQELRLFDRYIRPQGYLTPHAAAWAGAFGSSDSGPDALPLVSAGGYLDSGANLATPGDLMARTASIALPFATIQQSLQRGTAVGQASPTLVPHINAEANIITALICHADGKRPSRVCDRSVIRSILKHVK